MKRFVFLALLLHAAVSSAQNYKWASGNGGFNEDRAHAVVKDAFGNTYAAGQIQGNIAFNTFNLDANYGELDAFVVKYDTAGNAVWAFAAGGPADDGAYAITTDAVGNVYVGGAFSGTAVFGSDTLTSTLGFDNDIFIFKLDSGGNVLWLRQAGGEGFDAARGIAVSGSRLYVCGGVVVPASFGAQTVAGVGFQDAFLAGYDTDGDLDWVNAYGGMGNDLAFAVASDSDGNAYATGYFQDTATFGTFTLNNSSFDFTDAFVFESDETGTVQWAQRGGFQNNDDFGRAVAVDDSGNVFIGGDYHNIANFDGEAVISNGGTDCFIAKYNTDGLIQYASAFGGTSDDRLYGLSALNENLYVTGSFQNTVLFGSVSIASAGGSDAFIALMDLGTGVIGSALKAGGSGNDVGRGAFATESGVSVCGDFESTSEFGLFSLTANGSHDYFVTALHPALSVYPCPYNVTLSPDSLVLCPNTAEVFFTQTYDSYQWYKDDVPISGATQINYLVQANANDGSSFHVVVSLNGCTDTSETASVTLLSFPPPSAEAVSGAWLDSGEWKMCSGDTVVLSLGAPYNNNVQWYLDSVLIAGADNTTLSALNGGTYSVDAAPVGCGGYVQQAAFALIEIPTLMPIIQQSNDTLFAQPAAIAYVWYLDGVEVDGATGDWLSPISAGTYTVLPAEGECVALSDPHVVTLVNTAHRSAPRFYPNPVNTTLFVETAGALPYKIHDATARLIRDGIANGPIDTQALTEGVYFLTIAMGGTPYHHVFTVVR